jgi:hypothetical protein
MKIYEETTDNKLKTQTLSAIAKKLIMQRIPGITKHKGSPTAQYLD